MINYKNIIRLFFVSVLLLLVSCTENTEVGKVSVEVKTKEQKLADVIFNDGNVINAATAPKIISAEEVYNLKDTNIHILDFRTAKDFASGHLKNAVNIKMSEVLDYAHAKGLPMYDKVVMICYTGQTASYSSAILQMLGHKNIYVLEWGMCGWNPKFSKKWKKNISDKGISNLVTTASSKNAPSSLPIIESNKNAGVEILYTRARALLKESFGSSAVNFKYTMDNAKANTVYVACYQPESVYNEGHIENSVLYNQENSFNLSTDLLTLPTDKKIIIYSNKAYQSTFIMVYLRMLGYKAKTLKYGANSFMNSKLIDLGDGFSERVIKNYPYKTIKYKEVVGEVQEGGC